MKVRRTLMLRLICCVFLSGFAIAGSAQEVTPEEAAARLEPAVNVSDTPQVAQRSATPAEQSTPRDVDRLDLGTTSITGNQELPKVLYIVPWKKSDPGELMGRPVNTLLDEVLAPLDREEFVRQVEYYGDLYGTEQQE